MSDKKQGSNKNIANDGYSPSKRGYQPAGGKVTNGHKPEKSELKPVNPPKKK